MRLSLPAASFCKVTGLFTATVLAGGVNQRAAQAQPASDRRLDKPDPNSPAIIYVAKKIITMDVERNVSTAVAVAVADGRILAVGSLESVQSEIGNRPCITDLEFEQKVIMPGFVEHHAHPLLGVMTLALEIIAIEDWALPGKFSPAALNQDDYIERLKAVLKTDKSDADEVLFTWGYHHSFHEEIYRPLLDKICAEVNSERPVITWHRSCHEFILNTAALDKYGIEEEDLAGREQVSWENGHFYEKGMEFIIPLIVGDMFSDERIEEGLRIFKSYLLSKGITTICEPGTQMEKDIQEFWEDSLNADDAAFRTYMIPDGRVLFDRHPDDRDNLVAITREYLKWGRGKVEWLPQQVKLFCDGAIFSLLMQLEDPIDGHEGEWIATPEEYAEAFGIYWDAGYQINSHVNGDKGLQVVIDTLRERLDNCSRDDHRFTVVHFAISTEEQVEALGKMGATISANPYYVNALADRYSQDDALGPERANSMVRLGSVANKTSMPMSFHSDVPMAPADPLFLAWCAATRRTVSDDVADPSQTVTRDRALSAITLESAYVIQKEDELGSIEPDKVANFTILDKDPYEVPIEELKDISVWGVVFEGKKYEAPEDTKKKTKPIRTMLAPDSLDWAELGYTRG
ncbi:MAG: amidohydrolase family protein [Cyanothece sp. SIO2G6]|nr:amidohydrolase family protein [Cyanothece sp. SIO2G6]